MSRTLTLRIDPKCRQALEDRAAVRGVSLSEVARQILDEALLLSPLSARIRPLRGRLSFELGEESPGSLEDHLQKTNWRP